METQNTQRTEAPDRGTYKLLDVAGLSPRDPKCLEKLESMKRDIMPNLFDRMYQRLQACRQIAELLESPAYRHNSGMQAA